MLKPLLVPALLLFLLPLSAEIHRSNILGQDRGPLREGEEALYTRETKGSVTTLREGGKIIARVEKTPTLERWEDEAGREKSVRIFRSFLLSEERRDGVTARFFYDEANRLSRVTESRGDELLSLTFYTWDLKSGRLAAVEELSTSLRSFREEGFSVAGESEVGSYRKIGNLFVRQSGGEGPLLFSGEDGGVRAKRFAEGREVEEVYDSRGRMTEKRETGGKTVTYLYDDDDKVTRKTESDGKGKKVVTFYQDGRKTKEEHYGDGEKEKEITFLPTGRKEIVYREGRSYAEITYKGDGNRVEEVKYL